MKLITQISLILFCSSLLFNQAYSQSTNEDFSSATISGTSFTTSSGLTISSDNSFSQYNSTITSGGVTLGAPSPRVSISNSSNYIKIAATNGSKVFNGISFDLSYNNPIGSKQVDCKSFDISDNLIETQSKASNVIAKNFVFTGNVASISCSVTGGFFNNLHIDDVVTEIVSSNAAPTIGGAATDQAVNDNATLNPFSAITVADTDNDNVTATITLDTDAKGVLSGTDLTGTGPYSIASKTPAAMQTAIRALTFTPTENRVAATETTTFTLTINDGTVDTDDATTTVISSAVGPTISAISIPNEPMKVGDVVTATITVSSDTDDYTSGSGGISGTIGGFALGSLSRTDATTYTATFTVSNGGTDVAAGSDIPASVTLTDSGGKAGNTFGTAISQNADAIDANNPAVNSIVIADDALTAEETTLVTFTFSEVVTGFTNDDITIPNGTMTDVSSADGGTTYTATFTPTADFVDVTNVFTVDKTGLVDGAGNAGIGTSDSGNFTIETIKVTLSQSATSFGEDGGSNTITATLSAIPTQTVTVTIGVKSRSTAILATDFTLSTTSIVITAGNTTGTATLTGLGDVIYETSEALTIEITGVTNAKENGTQEVASSITDAESMPTLAFITTSSNGAESTASANLQVDLNIVSALATTVDYAITGTATGSGTDYTLAAGTLTISAGDANDNITIAGIVADALDEVDETVIVTLSNPSNATLGTNTIHTYTINDDDAAPSVAFSATSSNGAESTSAADLQVALSAVSGKTVTVDYAITGTATGSGTDYTLADGTLTISAGDANDNITIASIVADALDEADETVIVTLSSPVNAGLGTNTIHTYTINDDDPTPTIAFDAVSSSGAESTTSANIPVSVSAVSGRDVTVNYAVTGTATGSGTDYTLANGTLTITAGNSTANITIASIVGDALDEVDETVILTLSSPSNATLGTNSSHTYTILDDDATPTVSFNSTSSNGAETTNSSNLQVDLSAVSGQTVTVGYAVTGTATGSGTDYTLADGTLTFTAGSSSENITIAGIIGDALDENDETVIVTLSSPSNATLGTNTVHTYTILDDDAEPTIAFTSTSSNGAETVSTANLQVALTAVSGRDVSVSYIVTGTATGSGTDYTLADGTLTITEGNSSDNITIAAIVEDALDEADETVIVTLSSPTSAILGTNTVHTYTINDNDALPTVAFASAASDQTEDQASQNVQVSLSAVSGRTVTVNYAVSGTSTAGGTDHNTTGGTITINPGDQNFQQQISGIVDDAMDEENETIILTLSNPANATLGAQTTHTYTITDNDDAPTVTLSADNNTIAENGGTSTLTATLSAVSSKDVTVTLGYTGTAINGTDYNSSAGTSIVITAGTTSNTASPIVTSSDDTTPEGNETIVVDITNVTNGTESGTQTQTITISDDDTPNMTFTSAASNGAESVSSAGITVDMNMASSLTVTANYTVTGTAANGTDFALADGTVTFNPGSTRETITIASIVDDAILEANETVILTLSNLSNANAGTNQVYTYTINDNDVAAVTIADVSGAENGGNMTLIATLDNAVQGGFTVDVNTADGTATTADSDYTSVTSQTLTFAGTAGETQTFTVTPTADTKLEANETFTISMNNLAATSLAVNTSDGATGTITNDDAATVTIADVAGSESGAITVTATLDNAVQGGFTVDVNTTDGTATASNDYTAITSETLTFAGTAGETQTFTVSPTDDEVGETEESLTVSMDNLVTALSASLTITDQATVTIEDDDDNIAPAGYSIAFDDALIGGAETATSKATFAAAEVGATYNYSITSSNGGTAVTGTGTIATATDQITLAALSGLNDGTLTIGVTLTDPSGNVGTATTATTVLDTTAPAAPVVSAINADTGESSTDKLTNDNTLSIAGTAEASATVEVFIDAVSIGTTTATNTGVWTFDRSGTTLADGSYNITAKATDAAGNTGATSVVLSATVDTDTPGVAITTASGSLVNAAIVVTVTFDETVANFELADIAVTNGVASDLELVVTGQAWIVTVTPTADGEVTVQIPAAAANDTAGNTNTVSNTIAVSYDATAPMVTGMTRAEADQLNNNDADANFTVVFSEVVNGVDVTDFETVTTGTATATVNTVTQVDAKTYTVNVNGISGQGTVQLTAKADESILDNAGNPMTTTATGEAYTINWIPTAIALSNSSISENNAVGDQVGTLSTTDQDAGDNHSYSLIPGAGDADNDSFTLDGSSLKAAEVFDFELKASYIIRVRTEDGSGGIYDEVLEVTVENMLETNISVSGNENFDDTILGFTTTNELTITNSGEKAVEVIMSSSTSEITFLPGSLNIPVGETTTIQVAFTPQEAITYSGQLTFEHEFGIATFSLSGNGMIVTSVDDQILDVNEMSFYPNPASDILNIDLKNISGTGLDVSIMDLNGHKLFEKLNNTDKVLKVELSSYLQGIYLVRVKNKVSAITKKLIIKR